MSDSTPLLPVHILMLPREDVHITVSEFLGRTRLDLRHYVETSARPGMPAVATKKGINLPISELPKLVVALSEMRAAARAAGLLAEDDTA